VASYIGSVLVDVCHVRALSVYINIVFKTITCAFVGE
jgi:hypothetical protein